MDDNDSRAVVDTASALHVSELEVFRLAYRNWFGRSARDEEIDSCFSHYIDASEVPMWVRDFTRRVRKLHANGRLDVRRFGVEPAPDTTHWMAFLGGMAFAGMLAVLALLVYLAIKAQEAMPTACQLPPCY